MSTIDTQLLADTIANVRNEETSSYAHRGLKRLVRELAALLPAEEVEAFWLRCGYTDGVAERETDKLGAIRDDAQRETAYDRMQRLVKEESR